MPHRIVFTAEARGQLDALFTYLAAAADEATAANTLSQILDHIDTLQVFPHRGTPRDDLRVGLRTMPWKRRATIAYMAQGHEVTVIGIFCGGLDVESLLED